MIRIILTLSLAWLLLAGCSRSPRVTYYTLNATAAAEPATQAMEPIVIGAVTLPDLLDRPHFVVTVDANRVDILELHRWAAPLKSEIQRIIADNLRLLLKPTRVAVNTQNTVIGAVFQIQIDVQRFEMIEGKEVAVDLLWSIRRSDSSASKNGHAVVREPVTSFGYEFLAAAQSRALTAVTLDISKALRGMASTDKLLETPHNTKLR